MAVSEARTHPGPGAYHRVEWAASFSATHAVFVSRVPRALSTTEGKGLDKPGPGKDLKLATWGEGRAHSIGPRAKLRLTGSDLSGPRRYVEMAPPAPPLLRWVRESAPATIPDGTSHEQHERHKRVQADHRSIGPGYYTPRYAFVCRRTAAVDFGKMAGRDRRDLESPTMAVRTPAAPARGTSQELHVQEQTGALHRQRKPTFKRPLLARPGSVPFTLSGRDARSLFAGAEARKHEGAASPRSPRRLSYDVRSKLSRPLPPFERTAQAWNWSRN